MYFRLDIHCGRVKVSLCTSLEKIQVQGYQSENEFGHN